MYKVLLFLSLNFCWFNANAQGCSDAGLCVVNLPMDSTRMIYDWSLEELLNPAKRIKVGFNLAAGEDNVSIFQSEIEFNYPLGYRSQVLFKAPLVMTNGDLGKVNGLGDFIVGVNKEISNTSSCKLVATVAGKIPSNKSNKGNTLFGNLPMPYQTSLGTLDGILRIDLLTKKWIVASAYQKVIKNYNENSFGLNWSMNDVELLSNYFYSNKLKRGDNMMVKIERIIVLSKKTMLFTGLMPVFKVTADQVEVNKLPVKIQASKGMALNLTLSGKYNLSKNVLIRLNGGMPLVTRVSRNDGLTRFFVMMAGVEYSWH